MRGENTKEITAIPELLKLLTLKGCIVTIDAMGCQTEIAQAIIAGGGDYALALKGNQGSLHDDVWGLFDYAQDINFKDVAHDFAQTIEKSHGRLRYKDH